jgi:hypothetical protein
MRIGRLLIALSACLILGACAASQAFGQPQPVPRMSVRSLDKVSYVALAQQWKEYMDKHGETADGLVNLGMAERYTGEMDAARAAGKRAVELEPNNPRALTFYATILSLMDEQSVEAVKLLERSRAVAPDYGDALIALDATYLRAGELMKAMPISKTIFERRVLSRPLQDFAYNMLIGLPEGAILVTNGDNDTFPPLALQAGMDLRTDVVVVNRNLLNAPGYVDSLFSDYPFLRPAGEWKPAEGTNVSRAILERWIAEGKRPIYFAVSVPVENIGLSTTMVPEGLCWKAAGRGLSPNEAARVVLERYRLDSATDWDFAWDLVPEISGMMGNYVGAMVNLAEREGVARDLQCRLLEKAEAIAEFHNFRTKAHVKALLKKCEGK